MEQAFTTDAVCTKSMFTAPRLRLVQTDGAAVCSTEPQTGGRKILHVSRAEENGGGGRHAR